MMLKYFSFICLTFLNQAFADELDLTPQEKYRLFTQSETANQRFGLGGYLPIYSRFNESSSLKYYKLGLDMSLQKFNFNTTHYSGALEYKNFNLGFTNWMLLKNNETAFFRLGYSQTQESRDSNLKNLSGIAVSTYKMQTSYLLYGLYYGYLTDGIPVLLPILGWGSELSEKWSLKFILPLNISASYRQSSKFSNRIFIKPDSLRLPVKNENQYPGHDDEILLRNQRLKIGNEFLFQVSEKWLVAPEIGFMSRQKISIEDNRDVIASSQEQGFPYFQLKIQFSD